MAPPKSKDPKFPLVNEIPILLSATDRNTKTLKCIITAIKKHNDACEAASHNLTSTLDKCLEVLTTGNLPKHAKKK